MEVGTPEAIPVAFSSWRDEPTDDLIKEIRKAAAPCVPGGALDELEHPHLVDVLEAASDGGERHRIDHPRPVRGVLPVPIAQGQVRRRARGLPQPQRPARQFPDLDSRGRLRPPRRSVPGPNRQRLRKPPPPGKPPSKLGAEAIEKPIKRFNQLHPDEPPVEIEPAPGNTGSISPLVDAVLTQLSPDQFGSDQTGKGAVNGANGSGRVNDAIAAPYLQLVMKRLWETELENGSRTLRLGTLDELGGAQTIVKTHVDRALSDLEPHERETALDVFRYLVTPSGTKIALVCGRPAALAGDNTSRTPREVETLLERMSSGDIRISVPSRRPPVVTEEHGSRSPTICWPRPSSTGGRARPRSTPTSGTREGGPA